MNRFFLVIIFLSISLKNEAGWGFFAHKRINRMAVFTIPEDDLFHFYKFHIDYLTEHAVDPDKRRYSVEGEAEKHYIDIDHYAKNDEDPFDVVPKKWNDAVDKFSKDTLHAYGISPWNIDNYIKKLTFAFKDKDINRILKYSAEIGHYIADAHVPLHTTLNYNGQLTNHKGIHGFWESRVPELFYDNYDFFVGKAEYIQNPLNESWDIVEQSFRAVDSVLTFEQILTDEWPADRKFSYEKRGQVTMKVYSRDFSTEYAKRLNGMQEKRMRASIKSIGSYWYTAWVNAGQPDLKELYKDNLSQKDLEELNVKEKISIKKVISREHSN
ncbi:MAG: S1/P1 Nuclease [Crocinitomicaceae bacterium]|nr:S1/P1 Nuclease [Crocinitomicaceae bacterium]